MLFKNGVKNGNFFFVSARIYILRGNSAEIKKILKVLPLTRNQMGGILKELCGVDIVEFSSNSFSQN